MRRRLAGRANLRNVRDKQIDVCKDERHGAITEWFRAASN